MSAIVLMLAVGAGAWNVPFMLIALGSLAGAFLSGLVGITLRHERSPLPILAVVFGALAILFVVAELSGSLLGFGH